jgi:hypothetical protein
MAFFCFQIVLAVVFWVACWYYQRHDEKQRKLDERGLEDE